ncbi:MAG TPA: ATP synthase F1 subunit epsilon [Polyangiaceae bacterium]|nr:ATP synthase F1 subunit epsilon [Polyangiaceae bacterium]
MAEGAIDLEIVTPDGVALKEKVSSLTAPSVDGEFGVLPGHSPLLAALKTGIVSYMKDGTEVKVAVGSGFVEVMNDRAVLLTDHLALKDQIDPVQARLDLKDADEGLERYAGEPGAAEYLELMRKELWAAAQLTLYGDPPPPTVHTYYEAASRSIEASVTPSETPEH